MNYTRAMKSRRARCRAGYCTPLLPRNGRDDRIRTCDILLPKQARYQTAPHPDITGKAVLYPNSRRLTRCDFSSAHTAHSRLRLPLDCCRRSMFNKVCIDANSRLHSRSGFTLPASKRKMRKRPHNRKFHAAPAISCVVFPIVWAYCGVRRAPMWENAHTTADSTQLPPVPASFFPSCGHIAI